MGGDGEVMTFFCKENGYLNIKIYKIEWFLNIGNIQKRIMLGTIHYLWLGADDLQMGNFYLNHNLGGWGNNDYIFHFYGVYGS